MPSKKIHRLFPSVSFNQFAKSIARELASTVMEFTEHTDQFVRDEIHRDKEQMQLVIGHGRHAASHLMPPILRQLFDDLRNMNELNYESKHGRRAHVALAELYMWTSVCVISYMLGGLIGISPIFEFITAPVLKWINALVLVCFVVPVYGHLNSRKSIRSGEYQRGFVCRMSFIMGVLASYVNGEAHLWTPPLFLVPMWLGLITCYRASGRSTLLSCRLIYVMISTLMPISIQIGLKICVSNYCTWMYTFKWIVIWMLAFIDVQSKLGRLRRGCLSFDLELFDTVMILDLVQFILNREFPVMKFGSK